MRSDPKFPFDVKPYLAKGVFSELKDETLFRSVRVCFDTVEWSNGADLCPEVLYAKSEPAEHVAGGVIKGQARILKVIKEGDKGDRPAILGKQRRVCRINIPDYLLYAPVPLSSRRVQ